MIRLTAVAICIWFGFLGRAFAANSDCSSTLDTPKTQDDGHPVLVLVETDPWAMVLGADSPRFALYENGLAIYRIKDGFRQILLDGQRAADLRKAVNVGALACLNKHYSTAGEVTDQPSELLFFGRGGTLSSISVYGSIPASGEPTDLPLTNVSRLLMIRRPSLGCQNISKSWCGPTLMHLSLRLPGHQIGQA